MPTKNATVRNAVCIGTLCSVFYLAVYIVRNILSAVTPAIVKAGSFSTEQIGVLSTAFFVTYAVGQLLNGLLGDRIKAKYMIGLGLLLSGGAHILLPLFSDNWIITYLSYASTGFFLSMIYAPMTKVTAENTGLLYATRCTLGYTLASFLGSPIAGLFAAWMTWQSVFYTGSIMLFFMGVLCFLSFSFLERKGMILYRPFEKKKGENGSISILLKRQIIKFTLVSVLTGIVRTTVVFWMPTYISQYLNFSPETSALLFAVSTLIISSVTFLSVFLYELLKRNMERTLLFSFISSAICFAIVFLIRQPILNMIFLVLGIMSSNSAATMLWSVYCPGLEDTGMVSSATGFLDFASYIAAAVSSAIFANAVSIIGWKGLIFVWFSLMVGGVIISLPVRPLVKNCKSNSTV